ncbi:MAG TPA: hypothetical protein DCY74_03835 [Clostridiales bacterium]|nr:hypothetical protein [Clostridiales bacterium]HCG35193.1 hypothetical protein [Clostridiales bacterium]
MVRMIIGRKGTGKTKLLIELANKAVETSPGHVVCIEKGNKLIFDVRHQVRLVDTDEYNVNNADALYGMVCGIFAANYDIKDLFIDSSLKICSNNMDAFVTFIQRLEKLAHKYEVNCVTTVSVDIAELPASLNKYVY